MPNQRYSEQFKRKRKPPAADTWTSIKRTLRSWDQQQLLGLVGDLFKTVPEAKAAIVGRLLQDQPLAARQATLDELRRKIHRAIWPTRRMWEANPDLPAARRVADQYFRSTHDADGVVLLYGELVIAAMDLAIKFGWDDSSFYDSIARAAWAAQKHVCDAADLASLDALADQLNKQRKHRNFPGWGMDEVLGELVGELDARTDELSEHAEAVAAEQAKSADEW